MANRWEYTGYRVNGHKILQLYEIDFIPIDGSSKEMRTKRPLDRFKCAHCDVRHNNKGAFGDLTECNLSPDSVLEKFLKLFGVIRKT